MSLETSKLTSELLNGKNYLSWARSVTFALSGRGKLGHVSGSKPKPTPEKADAPTPTEKTAAEEWQMADHTIMSWILASIEPKLVKMFLYSKTAKELWDKLESMYGQSNNYSYIYQLKQEIYGAKKGTKNHTDHLVELTAKFEELDEYLPPTTDLKEIQKRIEHDRIYIYLGSLDASYEAVRSQILLSPELPSFSAVVAMVQREETRRSAMSVEVQEAPTVVESQAFAVTADRARHRGKEGERCSHCKRVGHIAEKCWVLHPHLKPKWKGEGGFRGQGEAAKKGSRTLDAKEERRSFLVKGDANTCANQGAFLVKGDANTCANQGAPDASRLDRIEENISKLAELLGQSMGRKGSSSFNYFGLYKLNGTSDPNLENKNDHKPKREMEMNSKPEPIYKLENKCLTLGFSTKNSSKNCSHWILDSGAIDHITCNKNLVYNFIPITSDQYFTVANNEKIKI